MTTITTQEDLAVLGTYLLEAIDGEAPPPFDSAYAAAVLAAVMTVTSPDNDDARNDLARLGLVVCQLLLNRLKSGAIAERTSAILRQAGKLQ